MKNKFYIILLFGIIFSSCEKESDAEIPVFQLEEPSQLNELEYDIYTLILNENIKNSDVVIHQKTSIIDEKLADYMFQNDSLNIVDDFTIENYYNLNSVDSFLDNKFDFDNGKVSLISPSEFNYLFRNQNDNQNWDNFYEFYPSSFGIVQFSRIGFNNEFNQAILDYSRFDRDENGEQRFYFLTKIDEIWRIKFYGEIRTN